jgi:peptidoglycan biosynthesis protein MviN/MurJ (putative lipid II flippase)
VASYLIARHFLKFKLKFTNTIKTACSAIVMAAVIYALLPWFTHRLSDRAIFILIPLGAIVYLGMLIVTRAVTKDMIALIKKPQPPTAADQKVMPEETGPEN